MAELLREEQCIFLFQRNELSQDVSENIALKESLPHTQPFSVTPEAKNEVTKSKERLLFTLLPFLVCFSLRNTLTGRKKEEIWNL